jgi:putative heme iron utilization protein
MNDDPQQEEAQLVPKTKAYGEAEDLLHQASVASLCTLSAREGGWPFGSIVPYALGPGHQPILLLARIAEHTKNLMADPRVSLLIHEPHDGGDPQAKARLTVLGRAQRLERVDPTIEARYLARVPEAKTYHRTHNFDFYSVELERLRYIGGFGKIFWLDPGPLRDRPNPFHSEPGRGVLDHLNQDHSDAVLAMGQAFGGWTAQRGRVTDLDPWGLDLTSDAGEHLHLDFAERADLDTIRRIVVALVSRARHQLAKAPPASLRDLGSSSLAAGPG